MSAILEIPLTPGESLYEEIDGSRVEVPPMAAKSTRIAFVIGRLLDNAADASRAGFASTETLFQISKSPRRNRRPDVAFVSSSRWPFDKPLPYSENALDVIPDLAVEVVSPTDLVTELHDKLYDYFEAGVRQVWVILPERETVSVYRSPTDTTIYTATDSIDCTGLIAGFHLPLSRVFTNHV
jgi:Uma2 family endonuclease